MISSECNGCEYQCKLSHIDICTLGSPCPHQRSTPMTNEEWLRQCNTEQLANVFGNMLFEAWKDGLAEEMHDKRFYENLVDFWLKQPHTTRSKK